MAYISFGCVDPLARAGEYGSAEHPAGLSMENYSAQLHELIGAAVANGRRGAGAIGGRVPAAQPKCTSGCDASIL